MNIRVLVVDEIESFASTLHRAEPLRFVESSSGDERRAAQLL